MELDGAAALAHGNRGRRPHNAVLESEAAAVVRLASTKYAGTNHTHLAELLGERDGINLSRPTVRRILVKAGMGSPRSRRSQQHRVRRQRMPQEGMLVQVDGSHHRWLGEDGPRFSLLLAVDDATGTVPAAMFFSRPGKPTDNAMIEAFNARLRAECLNESWFLSLEDAREKIEGWRRRYNGERPHSALGNLAPEAFALVATAGVQRPTKLTLQLVQIMGQDQSPAQGITS